MSSNLVQTNDDLAGNASGSYASLDAAFTQSPHMSDFQDKLNRRNPLAKKQINVCDIISIQSEEKINSNIDDMVGAIYNRNSEVAKLSGRPGSPLNRSQRLPNNLGSELLEDFQLQDVAGDIQRGAEDITEDIQRGAQDIQEKAEDLYADINQTSYKTTGMSFAKLLLLLILLGVLIYAIYCLFGGGGSNKNVSGINITSNVPGTVTLSETLQKFFN